MWGLIARADNRGLGQQTWAVFRNLKPAKTMVVNCHSEQPLKLRLDRFPNATVVDGAGVPVEEHAVFGACHSTYEGIHILAVSRLSIF
jgi:hypothetical protein